MTSAKPKGRRTGSQRRSDGDTTVRISQDLVPKLPHERDETPASPATGEKPPQPAIAQAAEDMKQGHKDTDRAPETNRIARKLNSKN